MKFVTEHIEMLLFVGQESSQPFVSRDISVLCLNTKNTFADQCGPTIITFDLVKDNNNSLILTSSKTV